MKTKAAVLVKHETPLWIADDINMPALEKGQVMVKVSYTGICGSQIMEINGKRGHDPWLPHMLGHEASGTVTEIGTGVQCVKPGDKVVISWIKGPGMDVSGARYQHKDTIINSGPVTTFSQYTIVSENRCTRISNNIPLNAAALLGCAALTGFGSVNNFIHIIKRRTIAIFGLGGVGLCALMAAKYHGFDPIITVDTIDSKLDLALELGATHTVNARTQDVIEFIENLTGDGVSFSVEATGSTAVIETAFKCIHRNGGTCVFAGHPPHGSVIRLDPFDLICGKKILGTWGGESRPDRDIPLLVDLYKEGLFPLDRLITGTYKLDDINIAIDEMQSNPLGRILIEM